jgi:hypothetical protein
VKINIKIDKLVLQGFTSSEQTDIQNTIIKKVADALKKEDNLFKNTTQPLTFNLNTLKINTTNNPQKIGHDIANTIKNHILTLT